jgi:hypothetical protein
MRRTLGTLLCFSACTSFTAPDGTPATPAAEAGAPDAAQVGDPADGAPLIEPDAPDDGGKLPVDAAAPCLGAVDCERVVFITFAQFHPNEIMSAAQADQKCNLAAGAAASPRVKGRTFRAWISDATSNPASNFVKGTKPYVRPSGVMVAANWAQFASTTHLASMNETEQGGAPVTEITLTWTGTNPDGTPTGVNCQGWTTRDAQSFSTRGQSLTTNFAWSAETTEDCDQDHRIYCVEE